MATFRQIPKLARQGDAIMQHLLGIKYYDGIGVTMNKKEAVKWYTLAAEQGHAESQFSLGWMYERGRGIATNEKEALKWYKRASASGHTYAKSHLNKALNNQK